MKEIVTQGLLYDFYGELLTDRQRQVYEDHVYNDMSLTEIAQEHGISRQAAHDLIRRCDKLLQDYEDRLHLVEKFTNAGKELKVLDQLVEEAKKLPKEDTEPALTEIQKRLQKLRESF